LQELNYARSKKVLLCEIKTAFVLKEAFKKTEEKMSDLKQLLSLRKPSKKNSGKMSDLPYIFCTIIKDKVSKCQTYPS